MKTITTIILIVMNDTHNDNNTLINDTHSDDNTDTDNDR